jgi:hypothetical protein
VEEYEMTDDEHAMFSGQLPVCYKYALLATVHPLGSAVNYTGISKPLCAYCFESIDASRGDVSKNFTTKCTYCDERWW